MSSWRAIGFAVALGVTCSGTALAAEGPVPVGTFAFGGERLFGFFHTTNSTSLGAADLDVTTNHIALLGTVPLFVPEVPRIGLDGFVVDGLSLGGNIFVDYNSIDTSTTATAPGTVTLSGGGSVTTFLIGPRIGYAYMFANSVGIWPRGGFTYYNQSSSPDNGTGSSTHFVSIGVEAPFIFELINGFALTAGPMFEISVDGSASSDGPVSVSRDVSYTSFGLTAGLLGLI